MGARTKTFLAALSGCFVQMLWQSVGDQDTHLGVLGFHSLAGILFAAGVLLPYVGRGQFLNWRTAALVVISGVSFYAAVFTASELAAATKGPNLEDFVRASFVGAAIVLVPLPFLLSFRVTWKYAASGLAGALVAGIAFGLLAETNLYGFMLGFAAWHVAMAGVLHFTGNVDTATGWLAGLPRRRFRAVAGMLSLGVIVPLVDDAIGAVILYRFTAAEGGLHVHEAVVAHGFRDERRSTLFQRYGCGLRCVGRVQDHTYAFQEYVVDHDDRRIAVFFMADESDPNCHRFGGTWNPPVDVSLQGGTRKEGTCLSYRVRQNPVATYAVRDTNRSVDVLSGLYRLRRVNRQIVRLADGNVMTETTYFFYHSRFLDASMGELESWSEFLVSALPPADGTPPQFE